MDEVGRITWRDEKRRLSDLKPWPRNPRQIREDQARRLSESFDEFGQVETLAIGPDGAIYNGHQRLNVLMAEHGADYEVDVRVASRSLTEKEREKLTVYLHKGAAGEWNFDALSNWDVDDLLEWGFEDFELGVEGWGDEEPPEDPGAQVDRAEELREKWQVESGQLWWLGEHRLICGDCTDAAVVERVMQGEKAEFGFADPPYNLNVEYADNYDDSKKFEEYETFSRDWWREFCEWVTGVKAVTPGIANLGLWHTMKQPDWVMAWVKMNGQSRNKFGGTNKWEPVLVWDVPYDQGIDVIQANNDYNEKIKAEGSHPVAKPPEMLEALIERFSKVIVLDPFLGSGTTIVACERLNRRCRAVEISPAYCAVAIERWHQMTGGQPELVE